MGPCRKNPSIISWLESVVTDHEAVERKAFKGCRLYPMLGTICEFHDATASSQVTMEAYPHMSEMRSNRFEARSVGQNVRLNNDKHYLWNHNQARKPIYYGVLDFVNLPTDPDTDRDKHHWRTFVDAGKYELALPPPNSPASVRYKNELVLYVDGFHDCKLRNYVPWLRGEASTLTGQLTVRMKRDRRENLQMFLKRTFTTKLHEACMHSLHLMSRTSFVFLLRNVPTAIM